MHNSSNTVISVITVVYNDYSHLEKTILSVLDQTYKGIEYIIIDGGSTDGTIEIIKNHEERIARWVSEPDRGIYDAMNKGIALSTGDWICFMNAGDVFATNDVLEKIFSHPIPDDTGVIYGDVVLDYSPYGKVYKRMNNLQGREQAIGICHQATLTRAVLLKETNYDLSYRIFADMNFFYFVWKRSVPFTYIPVAMAIFEGYDGVSSTRVFECFKESCRMRDVKWYNIAWWKSLLIAVIKKMMAAFMSSDSFRENKYKRILHRYEPYNP